MMNHWENMMACKLALNAHCCDFFFLDDFFVMLFCPYQSVRISLGHVAG
jgi:hypothetical protein